VLAVPDDGGDRLAVRVGIPDAPEGVVGDDHLDEAVKRRYVGDGDSEVPDRRFVHGLQYEVCHGCVLLHNPWGGVPAASSRELTDDHTVGAGGYQSDFIGEPGLGPDSGI